MNLKYFYMYRYFYFELQVTYYCFLSLFLLVQVLFVCTANLVENIPGPLLDRMEVIRLVGYITDEKTHIARGYLEKAAREGSGVKAEQVLFRRLLRSRPFYQQVVVMICTMKYKSISGI